jgi:hypothetical protein
MESPLCLPLQKKTIDEGQGQGSQTARFLIAGVLLFDEKIRQSTAEAAF